MAHTFNMCLSCGVPFIPMDEEHVDIDSLGNISLWHIQRMVRTNPTVANLVETVAFSSGIDNAHILHQSHHLRAVTYISKKEGIGILGESPAFGGAADYPMGYLRVPSSTTSRCEIATWVPPAPNERIDFSVLANWIIAGGATPDMDLSLTFKTCKGCNANMTSRHWFDYHLASADNANRLISENRIVIQEADVHNNRGDFRAWTPHGPTFTVPKRDNRFAFLTPYVGFYLDCCVPAGAFLFAPDEFVLYTYMSWVVLETTCLLCEYHVGSQGGVRRNRLQHNTLGAIEFYFSFFCYNLLCLRYPRLYRIPFDRWHRFYMWEAVFCPGLVDRRGDRTKYRRLFADIICPNAGVVQPSRVLLVMVCRRMVRAMTHYVEPIARWLHDPTDIHVPSIPRFFARRNNLNVLENISNTAPLSDFDASLTALGVDAMMTRVFMLCRDFPEEVYVAIKDFIKKWRSLEVDNITRNKLVQFVLPPSDMYVLAKLLNPPTLAQARGASHKEFARMCQGPRCSAWTSVIALSEMGAFYMGQV